MNTFKQAVHTVPVTLNGPIALVSKQADTVGLHVDITAVCKGARLGGEGGAGSTHRIRLSPGTGLYAIHRNRCAFYVNVCVVTLT